ncbi:MAG TPA: lysylphosphatidylglycerol synthase transmembrane domain-containing protein [Methylomirabilota bacterium]
MAAAGHEARTAEIEPLAPRRRRPGRWIKPLVTIALYAAVFYWTDAGAILARLRGVRLEFLAAGVLLYGGGQLLSTWRWQLLQQAVGLRVRFLRLAAFYFIGMFFNLFLPTIVGGDAVKALLLARESGSAARATVSVFMERNVGLFALLVVAVVAAWLAPPVELGGLSLTTLTLLLAVGYVAANTVLFSAGLYRATDELMSRTGLERLRPHAASVYTAVRPYRSPSDQLVAAVVLAFAFQIIVIGVVFLTALALSLQIPLSAVAVFVPLVSLAGMIPMSVNGLGVREALYILLFGAIGISAEAAVSLALLYLAVTLVASLPGGLAYLLLRTPARLAARQASPNSQ